MPLRTPPHLQGTVFTFLRTCPAPVGDVEFTLAKPGARDAIEFEEHFQLARQLIPMPMDPAADQRFAVLLARHKAESEAAMQAARAARK